jgi:hypothetical protein
MRYISIAILVFVLMLTGCNNSELNEYETFNNKIADEVDLWTSVNYEIIEDIKRIREIDKPTVDLKNPVMIKFLIRTANKGKSAAKSVDINVVEPIPFIQKNSSGSEGIKKEFLKTDEVYELYYTYTFENRSDLNDFMDKVKFQIKWIENVTEKLVEIKLTNG